MYVDEMEKPKETMSMHEDMCKDVKSMKVGEKCKMCVEGKITEMEDTQYSKGMRARMEITKMSKMQDSDGDND